MTSSALLARLRAHVNAGRGCPARVNASAGCPDCVPEVRYYCAVGRPLAERFTRARMRDVRAGVLVEAER